MNSGHEEIPLPYFRLVWDRFRRPGSRVLRKKGGPSDRMNHSSVIFGSIVLLLAGLSLAPGSPEHIRMVSVVLAVVAMVQLILGVKQMRSSLETPRQSPASEPAQLAPVQARQAIRGPSLIQT